MPSVQIECPWGRPLALVFLGQLQQFIELLLSHFIRAQVRCETLLKRLVPLSRFPLQLLNRYLQIFNQRLALGLLVMNHCPGFGIDV